MTSIPPTVLRVKSIGKLDDLKVYTKSINIESNTDIMDKKEHNDKDVILDHNFKSTKIKYVTKKCLI